MASQRHSLHEFQNTTETNIENFCVDTFIFYKIASFYSDERHDECISTLNITNVCMMLMWTAVSVTGLLIAISVNFIIIFIIIIIIRKTVAIDDISKLLTV